MIDNKLTAEPEKAYYVRIRRVVTATVYLSAPDAEFAREYVDGGGCEPKPSEWDEVKREIVEVGLDEGES